MKTTRTASREKWLAARLHLLAKDESASRWLAALTEIPQGRQRYIKMPMGRQIGAADNHEHHH